MPDLNIIGEISAVVSDLPAVSLTWAIAPGNNAWSVREGMNYGETQIAESDEYTGSASVAHPVDLHFQTSAHEGWPIFICEVSNVVSLGTMHILIISLFFSYGIVVIMKQKDFMAEGVFGFHQLLENML